ncbi:MAG: DDE-type integrase/transposase/recombinase [Polyangiaceae bacterium]|nr:DDE-type integrase/transposase/recombinase [Polyangiaceae bacterium]
MARRAYDHRIRELVCVTGDLTLARALGVPVRTAQSWLRRGTPEVVSLEDGGDGAPALRLAETLAQLARLEGDVRRLRAVVRLLATVIGVFGLQLNGQRLPDGAQKLALLAALQRVARTASLTTALRLVGLSATRYRSWRRRSVLCELDDRSPCPRRRPSRLTASERAAMKDFVTGEEHRHMPLRALALHAQRAGRVFAHVSTWARLVKERGWRRPRVRVHPTRPTAGVRATRPGELVHIDVTLIRLLDGTRAYLHAVIDNYSRRILAWKVAAKLDPANTCAVLAGAAQEIQALRDAGAGPVETQVYADSGVENVNRDVDALLETCPLRRVLAQVEVAFSNSMIESWWRSLKHNWLFLHSLDSVAAVEKLVAFYVEQHNSVMAHSAFRGATPDEVFFGHADAVEPGLVEARRKARADRIAWNRALECNQCHGLKPPTVAEEGQEAA